MFNFNVLNLISRIQKTNLIHEPINIRLNDWCMSNDGKRAWLRNIGQGTTQLEMFPEIVARKNEKRKDRQDQRKTHFGWLEKSFWNWWELKSFRKMRKWKKAWRESKKGKIVGICALLCWEVIGHLTYSYNSGYFRITLWVKCPFILFEISFTITLLRVFHSTNFTVDHSPCVSLCFYPKCLPI